jgi:uncharacterized protein
MATKGRQGFASMTPERRAEIAAMGGRQAQANGTAYRWTSESARIAGKKGGQLSRGGRGADHQAKSDTAA